MMKRTKIVCTIGPACSSLAMLEKMIRSGMNVARLNFSHGDYSSHKKLITTIRQAAKKVGEPIALLADLQGPKIRLGVLPEQGIEIKNGQTIELGSTTLPVTYKNLSKDVKPGHRILIEDGLMEVKVEKIKGKVIVAKVINGGVVLSHKGMNFPDSTLSVSSITEKDKEDLAFALKQGVHWVALSFVTSAKDVRQLRKLIGKASAKIIVKIEKHEALKNFDAILKETDAVMVARGDLGVETPAEDVPLRQKEIIAKCRAAGKPVVVATQMLDSMIRNPRPTRAEVSDVANAVIDHTEAVMLSGETATGNYPLETVRMMAKICLDTEASAFDDIKTNSIEHKLYSNELISASIAILSKTKQIDAVVVSDGCPVAPSLNRLRPEAPIYLVCSTEAGACQWNIRWGMTPFVLKKSSDPIAYLRKAKRLHKGDVVAVVTDDKKPQIELITVG